MVRAALTPEIRERLLGHRPSAGDCGCARCAAKRHFAVVEQLADQSLSVALRHAQDRAEGGDAEAARVKTAAPLPRVYRIPSTKFDVHWSEAIPLTAVLNNEPYVLNKIGKQRVYAISKKGAKRALYVGHVHGDARSVLKRIREHISGSTAGGADSATRQLSTELNAAAKAGQLGNYYIQAGRYVPPRSYSSTIPATNPNMTRVVEGLLSQILNPKYWDPNSTSFEKELEQEEEGDYAVVGPGDNRVQEIRTTEFPWNTVVHLCRDFGSGGCSGCSGTLIAPNVVLTAGHCLFSLKKKGSPGKIYVMPGRLDRKQMPYGSFRAARWYIPRAFIDGPNRLLNDWGLIVLANPVTRVNKFMPLWAPDNAALARIASEGRIVVAGYPSDRPVGTMWRHAERLRKVTEKRLLYTVDTCPGHSGSSIWTRTPTGPRIIGIHTAGILDENGQTYGCTRGSVLAPAGSLNSGIRLTPAMKQAIANPEAARNGPLKLVRFP